MRKLASANVLFFMDLLNSASWDYPDLNYCRGKFSLKRYYLFPHYVTSEVKIHYSNTYLYVVIELLDWVKGLTSKQPETRQFFSREHPAPGKCTSE